MTIMMTSSTESELDKRLEALIGKMVRNGLSDEERRDYQELSQRRARLMTTPTAYGSYRSPKRRRTA